MRLFAALLLFAGIAGASEYTRDGGTADEMCCSDKACTQIISQHADRVRAEKACGKLTDADGVTRYVRSHAFRITPSVPVTPPPPPPPPPPPTTASAVLTWTPPTTNTDGSQLTNLAGYRICRGSSPSALTDCREHPFPNATTGTWTGLASGTHWFAVMSVRADGATSVLSNSLSKVVP